MATQTINPQLVLASSSPYRAELLQRLTPHFITCSPDIDESPLAKETAEQLVKRLATAKAKAVSEQYSDSLIIGSDQVAVHNGNIIGKPGSHENAVQQLTEVSGKTVTLFTGLTLLNTKNQRVQSTVVPFSVCFRTLSSETIESYLNKDKPYQCAGSVKVESLGIALLEEMTGSDINALIGLPLIELVTMLNNERYTLF